MQTSGHGDDGLILVIPIGVSAILAVIILGGPTNTLEWLNTMVRGISYEVVTMVDAWF
jgi:hypothetical protein